MTEKLKHMEYIRTPTKWRCPYCGYTSEDWFPLEKYEPGSFGTRTFRCTECGKEVAE